MKLLLLTMGMGLVLVCTFQVKATGSVNDIDFNKLVGRWYPLFLASSDVGSNSAAFIHSIDVKADHLIFYFTLRRNGECSQVPVFAYKLENNKYRLRYPGNNILYLEDADPNEYLLIYTTNEMHGRESKGVELYSRQKGGALNQVIKSKFEEIYISHGLKKENVVDLMKTGQTSEGFSTFLMKHDFWPHNHHLLKELLLINIPFKKWYPETEVIQMSYEERRTKWNDEHQ